MKKPAFNPYLSVALATIIWGSSGIFIKYLNLPATTLAFFRTAVPTLILCSYFGIKKINPFRKDLRLILLASFISALSFFFYFVAYNRTSIANSLVTLYTWPIFALIFGTFFLKEKTSIRNTFLIASSFVGTIFIYFGNSISFSNNDFIGITSMLISAISYAIIIMIFKKLSATHSSYEIIFFDNFMPAIAFTPFLFINTQFPTTNQSIVAVTYALVIGLLAYILYYFGLRHLRTSTISLLSYLEVVSGILFAVVLLNEVLTWNIVLGGVLIIGSALMIKK